MTKKLDLSIVSNLDKFIDTIAKSGAKLDNDIQTAGVAVLTHFAQHKDVRLVNRLYLALGKGARHAALASWLLAHGALKANTDKLTKAEKPFLYDGDKVTDVEAATAEAWYEHKPSKAPDQVLDLQKAVKALISKAAKATTLEHGGRAELLALAKAVGIPESDVPSKLKAEAAQGEAAPL